MPSSIASVSYFFIGICVVLIHARLIPVQDIVDTPMAIDTVSIGPVISPLDQTEGLPSSRAMHKNTSVCYPIVGCFDNQPPFDNAVSTLPQTPDFVNTQFLLFTQEAPDTPQSFSYKDATQTIRESNLNPNRWLRIIVHGFFADGNAFWIKPLKDELLQLSDNELSDVLVVDWGNGAKFPHYGEAAANTRLVGKELGIFLQTLQVKGFTFDRIHCIGHSLGAHICGLASNVIQNQLARISGLDPAGPFFESKDVAVRLDPSDAKFIDVIHSNADFKIGLALGSAQASGHVDFYPNGGEDQPGCPSVVHLVSDVFHGQSKEAYEQTSCAHSRSHVYYTESINSKCPYTAFPCHDYESFTNGQCTTCSTSGCARMGFHSIESPGRGNMYLTTRDTTSFCGYHYAVEIAFDRNMVKTSGDIFVALYSNSALLVNISANSKSKAEFKAGDTLRHVFSLPTVLDRVDYAIVYFSKANGLFGIGAPKSHEIVLSRFRLQSLGDTNVYAGLCQTTVKIVTDTSELIMLNRADCAT